MMRRYESLTHFWEAEVDGKKLIRRSGKLGSKGRQTTKEHASRAAARCALEELIDEKLEQGYLPAVREAQQPPQLEPSNPEIEAMLDENPGSEEAAMVLADWLQSRQAPRGELMVLHRAALSARSDEAKKLHAEQQRLIKANASLFLGDLAEVSNLFELEWRFGFIQKARLIVDRSGRVRDQIDRQFKGINLSALLTNLLRMLLELRSARFLETISLESAGGRELGPALASLEKSAPVTLRSLKIASTKPLEASLAVLKDVDDGRGAWLGNRAGEYADAGIQLGDRPLRFPSLRELVVEPPIGFTGSAPGLKTIAESELPRLETLELNCSGRRSSFEQIARLLDPRAFPKLERLKLGSARFCRDFCTALLASPLAGTIVSIDLTGGSFDDSLAQEIAGARDRFPKLESFIVHRTQLTMFGRKRLQAARLNIDPIAVRPQAEVTLERVLEQCGDERAESSARELADPKYWTTIGRDRFRMWGACYAGRTYQVLVGLPELTAHCNCASRKRPCKHALALMFLAADGQVSESKLPSWLR